MISPMQRSKKLLENEGCLVAITEHWNSFSRTKTDLFGMFDLVAITPLGVTLAVQTTTGANAAARVKKIQSSPHIEWILGAWSVSVHGWTKPAKSTKWVCREIQVVSATETGTVSEVAT